MAMENPQPTPGPSNIRVIIGSQPGVLDPTQPSRLLRSHGAQLSFAAFDPLTAYAEDAADHTRTRLNTELYRPKRVVIETVPSGECTWRFVPSAKRENGVPDEGVWPRVVNICGEFVEMSQDQWDIYKLDPFYECFVPGGTQFTTIRNWTHPRPRSPQPVGKRRLSPRSPSRPRKMPPPPIPLGQRTFLQSESESEDEDEVEAMIINDEQPLPRGRATNRERERAKSQRRQDRQERQDKIRRKMELFSQDDVMYHKVYPNGGAFDQRFQPPIRFSTTPEPSKRKAPDVLDTSWSPDSREVEELRLRLATNYIFTTNTKRTRTSLPQGPQRERELKQKKMERSRTKQKRRMEEAEARRREREKRFLDEIMEEVPQTIPESTGTPSDTPAMRDDSMTTDDSSDQTEETQAAQDQELPNVEDAVHHESIEASRRKLAELERDRPLWEEEARQRRFREEAEEKAHKAKVEEQRREEAQKKAEVEARVQKEREEAEMKRREQEKNARRERELREQERKQRKQRWSFGPWTTQRALERYRILSESFDATKFSLDLPLNVEDVPWPSLQSPRNFSIEDVTWDSVERFFEAIRPHMRHQDYKTLLEQSHRRFHPDRWRSRNLLKTVEDEVMKGCMEVAANTVAQALTPIWKGLKDR